MEFEYVLIFIGIALAIILLYYGFTRFIKNKDLKQDVVSTIDVSALIKALGGKENIVDVKSSPSKLTVILKSHTGLDIEMIQSMGASGIVEGKENLSMIFGKQSALIAEDLKRIL
ncbi:hypothetical protein [Candidatus Stoquefichus massiliensis]|uniref:hypothetical protein n=1 Tax=Candidatus Stoquefichus massiliensis TaxID=1470350 RepID=UPI00048635AD|nr:hypothetical protein [Candidatus Stoquefichus massiliensis]